MVEQEDLAKMEDDFVLLQRDSLAETTPSPIPVSAPSAVSVKLEPLGKDPSEVLLSVIPPKQPESGLQHTSCDIVLVVDVSGSMSDDAELPDQAGVDQKELSGLSILDLVKHAARTILENLNEGDRLAVVTFSNDATLIQGLTPMTQSCKDETWRRIDGLTVKGITNLWSGIREGLNVFENHDRIGNVQEMFVLTDGVPNHMCPSQGYVRKLHPMMQKMRQDRGDAPTISCFGFGYHLRSALLRSIAEVGRGYYAFIPDAGMIGTVFIHAVANLFATFATSTEVVLLCSNAKVRIALPTWLEFDTEPQIRDTRVLYLGNIRYGQQRDFIVKLDGTSRKDSMKAMVRCSIPNQAKKIATTTCHFHDKQIVTTTAAIDYHISRHEICAYLAGLSTKHQINEHVSLPASSLHSNHGTFDALVESIQSRLASATHQGADIADLKSLLADLQTSDPSNPHNSGQIALAIQIDRPPPSPPSWGCTSRAYTHSSANPSYYQRWGTHYLPSILHAHMRQICLTFKDPGPLRYGIDSPLFIKMRDELDEAFDRLPAPKGSPKPRGDCRTRTQVMHTPVRMSRYNSCTNPCFAGHCQVRLSDGISTQKVEELRVGDRILTPQGERVIKAVLMTRIDAARCCSQVLCNVNNDRDGNGENGSGLWITPYHPIYHAPSARWVFPKDVANRTKMMKSGAVYSILLEADEHIDAHTIEVGGILCATLGHGLTHPYPQPQSPVHTEVGSVIPTDTVSLCGSQGPDVRSHPFFGSYTKVLSSLSSLHKDEHGRWVSAGLIKQALYPGDRNGIACGFIRPPEPEKINGKETADEYLHLGFSSPKARAHL